jgi:stage II sporulation protein D
MRSGLSARVLLSAVAAGGIALNSLKQLPQPVAKTSAAAPIERATLRVGMWTLWHDRELTLTPAAGILVRTCERCAARPLADQETVRAERNTIAVVADGVTAHSAGLWVSGAVTLAAHGETVTMRNPVAITARGGMLVIVVTLPVESYVERVVASESGPTDSPETLKALAVVVRSYALHEVHGHADYDLCDSTHCQHLHWAEQPSAQAEAATLATAGETLWFQGQRALTYFSKDCGGRTASPAEVWVKAKPIPYLQSRADRNCAETGGSEWASELTRAELTSALAARGVAAPGWQELTVARRGESGRAVTLRLDSTEISAEDFRIAVGEALGWKKIPSTWFEVSRQGGQFAFHGRGYGHGVGLCQKGATVMGAQGLNATEILAQSVPGATAADEATGQAWKGYVGNGFTVESLDAADATFMPELERARAEASQRSGLNSLRPFTVRAFTSTQAFRDATLEPGWVAAFTHGDWIATQPLRTLAARHLLVSTMRHEFLHALIERQAGSKTPLWLREGLAEAWGASGTGGKLPSSSKPAIEVEALDAALMHTASEADSEAAHRAAGWYAARLLERYGRAQVLEWLRSGIPDSVVAVLRQR